MMMKAVPPSKMAVYFNEKAVISISAAVIT
jgi:hypothetical protein